MTMALSGLMENINESTLRKYSGSRVSETMCPIYTLNDRINLHIPISEIEEVLPPKLFVRVHKSYIVAKKRIDLIEKRAARY